MSNLLNDHIKNIENTIYETNDLINSFKLPVINSDFRYNYFKFKTEFMQGGILYKDLCKKLRQYIIRNSLFLSNGRIKCDEYLHYYCKTDDVSFFDLVKLFTLVLH